MLELMHQPQELKDFQPQKDKADIRNFKLPRIERLSSRGVQKEVKSSTKLPTLRSQTQIEASEAQTERKVPQEQDFVGQVEKKLRLIMQQQNIVELQESDESDGDNFEKKINENKQILREVRRKNDQVKKQNQQVNSVNKAISHASRKPNHKNTKIQLYDKRMREFKEVSLENKFLHKKKELLSLFGKHVGLREMRDPKDLPKSSTTLKESNSNNKQIKEARSKEEFLSMNKILLNPTNKKISEARKMKKQYSQKNLTPLQKNQQLFDAIHSYLENPRRQQIQINPQKMVKERAQLEQKLRQYEQKLKEKHHIDRIHNESSISDNLLENQKDEKITTSTQWRKIGFNEAHCIVHQSTSFDKEIDRIGRYLQRNQKSLQKYVQNQKVLLDVQMARRQSSKERCFMSDKHSI